MKNRFSIRLPAVIVPFFALAFGAFFGFSSFAVNIPEEIKYGRLEYFQNSDKYKNLDDDTKARLVHAFHKLKGDEVSVRHRNDGAVFLGASSMFSDFATLPVFLHLGPRQLFTHRLQKLSSNGVTAAVYATCALAVLTLEYLGGFRRGGHIHSFLADLNEKTYGSVDRAKELLLLPYELVRFAQTLPLALTVRSVWSVAIFIPRESSEEFVLQVWQNEEEGTTDFVLRTIEAHPGPFWYALSSLRPSFFGPPKDVPSHFLHSERIRVTLQKEIT